MLAPGARPSPGEPAHNAGPPHLGGHALQPRPNRPGMPWERHDRQTGSRQTAQRSTPETRNARRIVYPQQAYRAFTLGARQGEVRMASAERRRFAQWASPRSVQLPRFGTPPELPPCATDCAGAESRPAMVRHRSILCISDHRAPFAPGLVEFVPGESRDGSTSLRIGVLNSPVPAPVIAEPLHRYRSPFQRFSNDHLCIRRHTARRAW